MKKNKWVLYLFESKDKTDLLKIMEFRTIKEVAYVLQMSPSDVSNYFHGLIHARGILKNCVLHQSFTL